MTTTWTTRTDIITEYGGREENGYLLNEDGSFLLNEDTSYFIIDEGISPTTTFTQRSDKTTTITLRPLI